MGDRYTITAAAEALKKRFEKHIPDSYQPSYNAAPTQILPVITQDSEGLSFFHWGQIPERSHNRTISKRLIYAETETLTEKITARTALMQNRCIIPADGYYDWKQAGKKRKIPYRFTFGNNEIVAFAGIWEEFEDDDEQVVHTFKIITTPANSMMQDINTRMPAILTPDQETQWMSGSTPEDTLIAMLNPYPSEKMGTYTVSPRFNDPSLNLPSLIKPSSPADQFGNYSLFD